MGVRIRQNRQASFRRERSLNQGGERMTKRYIITLMAANRVGILAAVTTSLAELGGDIQEVSQTVMQRFFTIIMAAEFPEGSDRAVIVDHIRGVCRPFGVEVSLKDPDTELLQDLPPEGVERYSPTAEGQDKPGMVRQISAASPDKRGSTSPTSSPAGRRGAEFVMVMELAVPGVERWPAAGSWNSSEVAVGLIASLQHEDIFSATNDPRPVAVAQRLRRGRVRRETGVAACDSCARPPSLKSRNRPPCRKRMTSSPRFAW